MVAEVGEEAGEEDAGTEMEAERDGTGEELEATREDTVPTLTRTEEEEEQEADSGTVLHRT